MKQSRERNGRRQGELGRITAAVFMLVAAGTLADSVGKTLAVNEIIPVSSPT
jgi:hypothetical protein